jgi:hypothetical protein
MARMKDHLLPKVLEALHEEKKKYRETRFPWAIQSLQMAWSLISSSTVQCPKSKCSQRPFVKHATEGFRRGNRVMIIISMPKYASKRAADGHTVRQPNARSPVAQNLSRRNRWTMNEGFGGTDLVLAKTAAVR